MLTNYSDTTIANYNLNVVTTYDVTMVADYECYCGSNYRGIIPDLHQSAKHFHETFLLRT